MAVARLYGASMMFSDADIVRALEAGEIGLEPFERAHLNPASVDCTLHPTVLLPSPLYGELDVAAVPAGHTDPFVMDEDGYVLDPGEFLLACTNEVLTLPADVVGRVEGKSSIGRLGLAVHITAGFIDPGFQGQITLEVVNMAPWSIRLRPHMRIGQLAFHQMQSSANRPYGETGHYHGQLGPTESRFTMMSFTPSGACSSTG